jgi:type IV secretory pathway VirB10-like protein
MRGSLTISAIVHLAVLGMCLVALAAQPVEAPATPAMTVNTISVKDFTELTKGVKDAPKLKVDDIKPVADKVDTPKPVDQVTPKVDQNRHLGAAAAQARSEARPKTRGQARQDQAAGLQARQDRRSSQEGRRQAVEAGQQGQSRHAAARRA